MIKRSTKTGFTIVELLIVIVVIGILAAITIVAYNGIQTRGNNAAIISAANQSVKAIQAYIAANGTYPGAGYSCLTATSGCLYSNNPYAVNSTVNNNIATVATLPASVPTAVPTEKGIFYEYNTTSTFNGVTKPVRIGYALIGNAVNCGVSNVANSGGLTMVTSTSFTASYGTYTICFVSIDGPSS